MRLPFENEHFVAADKPAGWLSVPSRQGKDDARPCLGPELATRLGCRLWPVHRLDAEVTGLILFAKSAEAHRQANGWFERREVDKTYEAWTEGDQPVSTGELIWRSRLLRGKKRAYESPHGKPAETLARCLGTVTPPDGAEAAGQRLGAITPPDGAEAAGQRLGALTPPDGAEAAGQRLGALTPPDSAPALRWTLSPRTGRPHQLRYELARHGHPILGDTLYGAKRPFAGQGIALRCVRLGFDQCPGAAALGLPTQLAAAPLADWLAEIRP